MTVGELKKMLAGIPDHVDVIGVAFTTDDHGWMLNTEVTIPQKPGSV